jgi:hypothetical protein
VSRSRPTAQTRVVDYFEGCPVAAGGLSLTEAGIAFGSIRGTPMNAIQSPAQSELYADLLPVEPYSGAASCSPDYPRK